MNVSIQSIQQSMQALGLNTEKNLSDPKTVTPHQAGLLYQHMAIMEMAHQIMKSLQQHQHMFKSSS